MRLWRRARLLAHAEHELRGALTALALEAPQLDLSRARAGLADLEAARTGRRPWPEPDEVRLDRLAWSVVTRADLAARRAGGAVRLDWRAGEAAVAADRGRLAQALENLLDNAVEHGGAQVTVSGRRTRRGVRIVVRDEGGAGAAPSAGRIPAAHSADRIPAAPLAGRGLRAQPLPARGHGLAIAAAAARACGGRLQVLRAERGTAVAIDLPAAR